MDATRFYLYRKYSNPKLSTKESEEVELRIVVPLMLHKIFDRLMNIKSKHVNYDKEVRFISSFPMPLQVLLWNFFWKSFENSRALVKGL